MSENFLPFSRPTISQAAIDEVVECLQSSGITFVASLNTIVLAGGKPVLVDVDLKTYNMDVKQLALISPSPRLAFICAID